MGLLKLRHLLLVSAGIISGIVADPIPTPSPTDDGWWIYERLPENENFSYALPNSTWPGPGSNLHGGAFSTPFVYAQRDGYWNGRFHRKLKPEMIGDPYSRGATEYQVRSPAVVGSRGEIIFATSSPSYLYALPDIPNSDVEANIWTIKLAGYWFVSLSDSSNAQSFASPLLARIPRWNGDGLRGCGRLDTCNKAYSKKPGNTSIWIDEIALVGVTDSLSSGGNQGYDNSKIVAVRTDDALYPEATDKVLWEYPPKSAYSSADGTQLGKLYGSGALHESGTVYWATRCTSTKDQYPPYEKPKSNPDAPTQYIVNIPNQTTTNTTTTPIDYSPCGEGQGNNTLLAIDLRTGQLEWSFSIPYGAASTPHVTDSSVYIASMGMIYVINRHGARGGLTNRTIPLYDCYDLNMCGRSASESPAKVSEGAKFCPVPSLELLKDYFVDTQTLEPSPVAGIHDDIVIPFFTCVFSISEKRMSRFNAAKSGSTKYSGSEAWMRYTVAVGVFDRRYYVGDEVGRLHALKLKKNGHLIEKWHADTPHKRGIISSPVVLGDGTVVVLTAPIRGTVSVPKSFMVGFSKPEFTFKAKGRDLFSVAMSEDEGLLDQVYQTQEGAQPVIDRTGRIIIPTMDETGVRVWGGDGGCAKGLEVNKAVVAATDALCVYCPAGEQTGHNAQDNYFEIEQEQCQECAPGKWTGPDPELGVERQTFCYKCSVEFWCEGGNQCHEDRQGIACAECRDNFYSVGDFCRECPDASWKMVALFLALILLIALIFLWIVEYSQITAATQFTKDLKDGDEVKILDIHPKKGFCYRLLMDDSSFLWISIGYLRNRDCSGFYAHVRDSSADMCWYIWQMFDDVPYVNNAASNVKIYKVERVVSDSRFEVRPPIELNNEIRRGLRYQIRKNRQDGHSDWINGRGLVQIPKPGKSAMLPKEQSKKKAIRFARRCLNGCVRLFCRACYKLLKCCRLPCCCSFGLLQESEDKQDEGEDDNLQDDDSSYDAQTIVLGKVTYHAQIFAAAAMIFVTYLQSVTLFLNIGLTLTFPKIVVGWLSFISFMQIPFSPPECDISLSYYTYWIIGVTMPMAICIFFGLGYLHARGFQDPVARRTRQDQCVQAAVIYITVFYVDITNKAAEPLDCTTYADGVDRLDEELSIICSANEVTYVLLVMASIFFFLFYGIGIPAFLTYTLVKAKRDSKINSQNFAQRYGWLYQRYNGDHYYWEIIVMFRKLLLVVFASQLNNLPQTLAVVSMIVLAGFLYIQRKFRPYISFKALVEKRTRSDENSANDQLESMSLLGQILAWALWLVTKVDSSDASKSFDSDEYDTFTICFLVLLLCAVGATFWFWLKSQKEQAEEEERMRTHGVMTLSDGGAAARMFL